MSKNFYHWLTRFKYAFLCFCVYHALLMNKSTTALEIKCEYLKYQAWKIKMKSLRGINYWDWKTKCGRGCKNNSEMFLLFHGISQGKYYQLEELKRNEQGFFQTDCFIWLWEHFEKTKCIHQDLLHTLVTSKQPCKLFMRCLLGDVCALRAQHCIRMFLWWDQQCPAPHSELSGIRACPHDLTLTAGCLRAGRGCAVCSSGEKEMGLVPP